ncbi:SigE family RNA polymerase sigma factor [soil metagenome]
MMEQVDFATFVRSQTTTLVRSAYLLTGDRASAEDLVQETFARLYPRWERVAQATVPAAYVRRCLTNNFINSRRGKNSAAAREILTAEYPQWPSVTDVANQVSDAALVTGLLKTLPARQRAVLVMRFFHDLSDEQIAADLGIRLGTVRSIVSRSLAALREAEAANHGRRPGTAAGEVSHDR